MAIVFWATPLRSTPLPSCSPTGLRGTTDWFNKLPYIIAERKGSCPKQSSVWQKLMIQNLCWQWPSHKPHSHFFKQFTIMRCLSVWFWVCVTVQQDHNCIYIFLMLKIKKTFFKGYWWFSITYVPDILNKVFYCIYSYNTAIAQHRMNVRNPVLSDQ